MFKGGYKIIDLADTPFTTAAGTKTIPGIHDRIESAYRKPIMLAGFNMNGTEYDAAFAVPALSSGSYVFTVYGFTITVTAADAVTVAAVTES